MKSKIFIGVFLIIILIANMSLASYSTVTMEVVEEPICTIALEENSKFEKKLISKDLKNKEVTLQLQVTNQETLKHTTGEIMIVLDISNSMKDITSDNKTRRDLIFDSANTLITNLLEDNTNLDIGIVSFSSNEDLAKEGTIEDATLVSDLSNDSSILTDAISNIELAGGRTNLQAGITLARQQFSEEDNNKYIIILTDGVPNLAIDYDGEYYSDDVINKTKQELKDVESSNISLITMLSGTSDPEYVPAEDEKSYEDIVNEIFGDSTSPTAGKFYYVTDDKIEDTVTTDIYNSLVPALKTLKDITIVDYFPDEIIKNFDFAYVSEANIGTISSKVDTDKNSITWEIPELDVGETATVQYKLKLKENYSVTILSKLLNTNEKVDLTYTDLSGNNKSRTSSLTPTLRLTEPTTVKEEPKEEPKEAPKTPSTLPKAGTASLIGFGVFAGGLFIYSTIKLINIYKKMN